MRISLEGWSRSVLYHVLVKDLDVSDLELSQDEVFYGNKAYVKKPDTQTDWQPDGLYILAKAEKVSLNGDFLIRVSLTKDEIANLARIAFRDDSFADVIAALSAGSSSAPAVT